MKNKNLIHKHRTKIKYTSVLMIVVGISMGYFYYGTEPQETIGGFLCGLGVGLFLIYFAINQNDNSN